MIVFIDNLDGQLLTIRMNSGEVINKLVGPKFPSYRGMKNSLQDVNMFLQFKEDEKSPYICDFIVAKLALRWTKG